MRVRSDADLVRAAKAGESAAFEELHARYARVVHAIALGRMAAADADDITQNVFMTAYTRLDTLRDDDAFAGWIARIARNACADFHRSETNTLQLDTDYATRATQTTALEAARVLAAIRALPEAYRETLMLRLVEGMSAPEIAERTGMTAGSVRVNIHRGMQLLREALER